MLIRTINPGWELVRVETTAYVPPMLSDRSYMRDDYARPNTSITTWIICATIAGFILQHVTDKFFAGSAANRVFEGLFELSRDGLLSGKVWTLFTYALMHAKENLLHIVVNMVMVFFLSRELLPLLGNRRFLGLYAGGVGLGGLLWLVTNWSHGGNLVGASAGVAALFMMFTVLNPNRPITFLLFFIIPVTVKPKWVLAALGGYDLFMFIFFEALGDPAMGNVAHSAHLGGYAAGWLFFRFVHQREWRTPDRAAPAMELPAWMRRSKKTPVSAGAYKVNLSSEPETPAPMDRADLRAEVDRILDKINSKGFGALTDDEKRCLDQAKDLINRR